MSYFDQIVPDFIEILPILDYFINVKLKFGISHENVWF